MKRLLSKIFGETADQRRHFIWFFVTFSIVVFIIAWDAFS